MKDERERIIDSISAKRDRVDRLLHELREGAHLRAQYGIIRHEISQMQRVCTYDNGEWRPTGKAEVWARGIKHTIEADALTWRDEWEPNAIVKFHPKETDR